MESGERKCGPIYSQRSFEGDITYFRACTNGYVYDDDDSVVIHSPMLCKCKMKAERKGV